MAVILPDGARIGSVSYLNARPLIYGIEDRVDLARPALLADRFSAGEYDAALVPVFELLREREALIADGAAIAAKGTVFSVFLAYRGPLESVTKIVPDFSSRTSNNLLRCLLAERGMFPEYIGESENQHEARLIIGDPAIQFRRFTGPGWQFYDLGEEWQKLTGLPFVFAAWGMHPNANSGRLADGLRDVREEGLAGREEIARGDSDPAFALKYMTEYISYDLGADEKRAISLFDELLRKHGCIDAPFPAKITWA